MYQYYEVNDAGKRIYIKTKDKIKAKKAIQKNYLESVRKVILTQRYRIERFLKLYDPDAIENVFEELCEARKVMVDPLIEPDASFIERWKDEHPGSQNTFPKQGQYVTDNEELVRSKSEKILADLFFKLKIPYVYEPTLVMTNGSISYPDFALLNVRTRKTYYWEHLGLISDLEYASKNLYKLYTYEKNGYIIGENLLISMETPDMPLDTKYIKKKIEKYLL